MKKVTGLAAPLPQHNVDTDIIMPKRFLRTITREGLAEGVFADLRFNEDGTEKSEFVLNQQEYSQASILLTGRNMGCGSSREFAVWALVDFGIRAIIAPSFGAIFFTNCIRNGLLPIVLDEQVIASLADYVELNPQANQLDIDLKTCHVIGPEGVTYPFELQTGFQVMLLEGLDAIDVTNRLGKEIDAFKTTDIQKRPWAYLN